MPEPLKPERGMPIQFADAICDERVDALERAALSEQFSEAKAILRWHHHDRWRMTPGYACNECRALAQRIWDRWHRA